MLRHGFGFATRHQLAQTRTVAQRTISGLTVGVPKEDFPLEKRVV